MPSHYHTIEQIQIGNQKPGLLESDGVIYAIISSSYTQGYTDGPSKFSISIVSTDSSVELNGYIGTKFENTFAESNLETITILDDDGNGVFSFTGFLISYSENLSAGNRSYTLEYVDTSVILDKIFVGLPNRHKSSDVYNMAEVNVKALCTDAEGISTVASRKFRLDGTRLVDGVTGMPLGDGIKLASERSYNPFIHGEKFAGGMMIVGDEQWSENSCSIPKVDYELGDLLYTMSVGANILSGGAPVKGIRREHSGTLRAVLSNWCAEFGYTFIWGADKDYDRVSFINMGVGINPNFRGIKSTLKRAGIESMTYSKTNDSMSVGLTTRFMKPHNIEDKSVSISAPVPCSPLRIQDVFNFQTYAVDMPGASSNVVRGAAFSISCALSKYNTDIRTLWYLGGCTVGNFRWEALGIYLAAGSWGSGDNNFYTLGKEAEKNNLLRSYFLKDYDQIIEDWGGEANVKCAIVYRSEDMENRFIEWERSIADNFIGQYFKANYYSTIPDSEECGPFGRRMKVADSDPPFEDLIGGFVEANSRDPYGKGLGIVPFAKFGHVIKRSSAPWAGGIDADRDLDVKTFLPRFFPIDNDVIELLIENGTMTDDVISSFTMGGARFELGIMVFHTKSINTSSLVSISNHVGENNSEVTFNEINKGAMRASSDCKRTCSIDIEQLICRKPIFPNNLRPGPNSNLVMRVDVVYDGESLGKIFMPAGTLRDSGFTRIEKIEFSNTFFKKAIKHFEFTAPSNVLNAASINVVTQDMTNQVLYLPSETGDRVLTADTIVIGRGSAKSYGYIDVGFGGAVRKYHNATLGSSVVGGGSSSKETLSAVVPSYALSRIAGLLNVEEGISSFTFSIGANGSDVNVSFANLPPTPPSMDILMIDQAVKTSTIHFRN